MALVILGACAAVWATPFHAHGAISLFFAQLRQVAVFPIVLDILSIYFCFALRAMRWSVLLRPLQKTHWTTLLPPQLIGFAAVALLGRAADLARPYLVARRLRTSITMQVAVYSIERAFDLGAAAILFSVTLALAPQNGPHRGVYFRAGALSLGATVILTALAYSLRFHATQFGDRCDALLRGFSPRLADAIRKRLVDLQSGFQTLASFKQFATALSLSVLMWIGIAFAYLEAARAFRSTPSLAGMTFPGVMLLLAASLGASLLQLPVLGWLTQVAALAATYHGFYGVPIETASACGAITLLITTLSIVPGGLLAAWLQGETLQSSAIPFAGQT